MSVPFEMTHTRSGRTFQKRTISRAWSGKTVITRSARLKAATFSAR